MSNKIRYDVPTRLSFERVRAPFGRFEVQWLPTWTPEADQALAILPPMATCPRDLFRRLMLNPAAGTKRCALVSSDGAPVALIGLRHREGRLWELVTDRLLSPDSWAPAIEGFLFPALRALQCEVEILEWSEPLPEFAKSVQRYPYYRLDLESDYWAYWRKSKHIKRLKSAAARSRRLEFEVDHAGIAEWTIRTWGERWGAQRVTSDLLLAADYYAASGHHHAFGLIDNGVQCAGLTGFVRGNDLVLLKTARLFRYEPFHVGTRVYHLAIEWASERGFKTISFGSGPVTGYKRWWAPPVSDAWRFSVRPTTMDVMRRGKAILCNTLRPLRRSRNAESAGHRRGAASTLLDRHPGWET